jgi:hypothetical protein
VGRNKKEVVNRGKSLAKMQALTTLANEKRKYPYFSYLQILIQPKLEIKKICGGSACRLEVLCHEKNGLTCKEINGSKMKVSSKIVLLSLIWASMKVNKFT